MKPSWDFVISSALFFLIPGVGFTIAALANLAKYIKSLTSLGIVVDLVGGGVLTVIGVSCLLGIDGPWLYQSGFVALGILMVMEGTGRLYVIPPSVTMQWIFMVGGLALLAFLAFALSHYYYYNYGY